MILKIEDLRLFSVKEKDPELERALQDYSILQYMSEKRMHPGEMDRNLIFKIEKSGEVVGEVSLNNIRWYNRKATLSVILNENYHGMGIGRKACLAIMKYAFDAMNFHRIEAEAVEYNPKSQALLDGLGFKKEGIFREAKFFQGKYHSVIRYGILETEFRELFPKL